MDVIMMYYERYKELKLDASLLGFEDSGQQSNYFCTPKSAQIIGRTGADGIHFCFVCGFGEMVFAVSPMSTPGNYVHPVAGNFMDFLRLMLACNDTAALEQIYCWEQEQFDAFLQDNPPTDAQKAVLNTIREALELTPMEQPFSYVKGLQAEFDYSRIEYTEEYYEQIPDKPEPLPWKVYFDCNFWGHRGHERAGREITLRKRFTWNKEAWHIPAVYLCSKGIVMDICLQVPAKRIRSFIEKWNFPRHEAYKAETRPTEEELLQMDAENPLTIHVDIQGVLNGTVLHSSHGCGVSWNPCFPEGNGFVERGVVEHYGLDPGCGWVIWRTAFPWTKKRKPQLTTLSVTLKRELAAVQGSHFHTSVPGEQIAFTHPVTGAAHTLTVQEYGQREIDLSQKHFNIPNMEFPRYYTAMSYTLSPDLPDGTFNVTDCRRSDTPRQKDIDSIEPHEFSGISSIGIIGGADGPTVLLLGSGQNRLKQHAACSALHFEPVDSVEWRMVFYEKICEDITLELI